MNKISKHISYAEGVKSKTASRLGIDNTPDEDQLEAMGVVARKVFEPVRVEYNTPIAVTSFFRSKSLNEAIGGSNTSQHCTGEAIDIDAHIYGGVTNKEIFDYIKDNLVYDQLIWEFGTDDEPDWIHVSYSKFLNRGMTLQAVRYKTILGKTKTKYKFYD
jgi:hypothetical protein